MLLARSSNQKPITKTAVASGRGPLKVLQFCKDLDYNMEHATSLWMLLACNVHQYRQERNQYLLKTQSR